MKLVYLASARDDIDWIRRYYERIFPDGLERVQSQFRLMEELLSHAPAIGRPISPTPVRELSVPHTPFSYIYRVKENQIEVLRVWDERQDRR